MTTEQLFLVERECGGPVAVGGGCGSWFVVEVRALREGDMLGERVSPERERTFYGPRIQAAWDRADPDSAILGPNWACPDCRVQW